MRLLVALLVLGLVGCATRPNQPKPMTYQELTQINVNRYKCTDIDWVVSNMETQLKLKGLDRVNPEDLNDEDRKYNATARIVIWSMRIGCNNPNRYKK